MIEMRKSEGKIGACGHVGFEVSQYLSLLLLLLFASLLSLSWISLVMVGEGFYLSKWIIDHFLTNKPR